MSADISRRTAVRMLNGGLKLSEKIALEEETAKDKKNKRTQVTKK